MTDEAIFEQEEISDLPDNWVWTTISEICEVNPTIRWQDNFTDDMPITFVPMAAVDEFSGTIANPEIRPISEVWTGYKRFSEGDVIFARITPSMENGKAAIAIGLVNGLATGSTEFHVLHPPEIDELREIIAKWLYHFIRQEQFRGDAAHKMTGTAGQLRVPADFMSSSLIPLAPLNEQRRIVGEIEAQFTRLDAGIAALKRLEANLKRYKASVLKAACEGDLAPQDPDDEPASELLARILRERREQWEADKLAEYKAKGKKPPKNWQDKYKEPVEPEIFDDSPELPDNWTWATVEQLAAHEEWSITDGPFGSNLKTSHYTEEGPRVIRLQNIGDGQFIDDDQAHIGEEHYLTLTKHEIFAGDLVIAALGQSLPRACIIPDKVGRAIVKADCIRFNPHTELADVHYLNAALNSEILRRIGDKKVHGVGRPRLNQAEVKSLSIPLPPREEQGRIARAVEVYLSILESIEVSTKANLERAERLRQSILKEAFAGRLVPQDPSDEPASELLARIRAERGD